MIERTYATSDNSGFSLIELIVVVLIMGIFAVTLTPQVLKWVDNARKSSDLDYMHSLESAVQFALMNNSVNDEVSNAVESAGNDVVLRVNSSGTNDTIGGESDSNLLKKTAVVLGFSTDDESIKKFKGQKTSMPGGVIEIHINGGRAIGTYKVNGSEVDLSNE